MTMNAMHPGNISCKRCGKKIIGPIMWVQKDQMISLRGSEGRDGPYCRECHIKVKYPQWTNNEGNMEGEKRPDRVNRERSKSPQTSVGNYHIE